MDLRPIEARADEFFTWAGRFDSGKRVDAAFASAADVPNLIDEVKRLRADILRRQREAFAELRELDLDIEESDHA